MRLQLLLQEVLQGDEDSRMMRSPLAWMFTVVLALLALSLFVSIFQTLAWVIAPLSLLFAGLRLHRVAVAGPPAST